MPGKSWFYIMFKTLLIFLSFSTLFAKIPQKCLNDCTTSYGKVLGKSDDNTIAYSNCSSDCVYFSPNKYLGTYTGIKWQCVEYARRWLLKNKRVVYGDVDYASDIWKLSFVTNPKGKKFNFTTHLNGTNKAPEIGNLLIYSNEFLGTGHVAVITGINIKKGFVLLSEQNYDNTEWQGNFARKVDIIVKNKQYWILDSYLLGWKRVEKKSKL